MLIGEFIHSLVTFIYSLHVPQTKSLRDSRNVHASCLTMLQYPQTFVYLTLHSSIDCMYCSLHTELNIQLINKRDKLFMNSR